MKVRTIFAPSFWASALINGDQSSLSTDDVIALNAWRRRELEEGEAVVSTKGEAFFSRVTIIGPGQFFVGNVVEYQILGGVNA